MCVLVCVCVNQTKCEAERSLEIWFFSSFLFFYADGPKTFCFVFSKETTISIEIAVFFLVFFLYKFCFLLEFNTARVCGGCGVYVCVSFAEWIDKL